LVACVSPELPGWLRLRVFKHRDTVPNFAGNRAVRADPRAFPDCSKQLTMAILGAHEFRWLDGLAFLAATAPDAIQARFGNAAPCFFEYWRSLGAQSASAIWSEAGMDRPLGDPEFSEVLMTLKRYALDRLGFAEVEQALGSLPAFGFLDRWLRQQLTDFFGCIASDPDLDLARRRLDIILDLARRINAHALSALEQKYSAELSWRYARAGAGDALLDCSFDSTAEGLSAYRRALVGDFAFLGGTPSLHASIHPALLTHGLSRLVCLETHLPFLTSRQWKRERWETLARAGIETDEDGRLFAGASSASERVRQNNARQSGLMLAGSLPSGKEPRFTLTFTDQRRLSLAQARLMLPPLLGAYGFEALGEESWPDGGIHASLTLSVPGSRAAAWFRAPGERDPRFFRIYSAVSIAVQKALRRWIPYVYFSDLDGYSDPDVAFPLIVYGRMRPFPGSPRAEFTHDLIDRDSTALAGRTIARDVAHELRRISQLLLGAGRKDTARCYSAERARAVLSSVQHRPRALNSLLAAEGFLVDNLVGLGVKGRQLSQALPLDSRRALWDLAKFSAAFIARLHRHLRRLYGGCDFAAFGSLILVEATRALAAALREDASIAAVLSLTWGSHHQTLVSPAYGLPSDPPRFDGMKVVPPCVCPTMAADFGVDVAGSIPLISEAGNYVSAIPGRLRIR
jgi:hypothetical protein